MTEDEVVDDAISQLTDLKTVTIDMHDMSRRDLMSKIEDMIFDIGLDEVMKSGIVVRMLNKFPYSQNMFCSLEIQKASDEQI